MDYEIKNNNSEYLEYIQRNKRKIKRTPVQLNPFIKRLTDILILFQEKNDEFH